MGKLFAVTMTYTAIVYAESAEDAVFDTEYDHRRDITSDQDKPDIQVIAADLRTEEAIKQYAKWDGKCIPYGYDEGTARLSQILEEINK